MAGLHTALIAFLGLFAGVGMGTTGDADRPVTDKPAAPLTVLHWPESVKPKTPAVPPLASLPVVMVQEECPSRDEVATASLAEDGKLTLMLLTGKAWSAPVEICPDAGQQLGRNFDLKYEQASGDALIVYYNGSTSRLAYRMTKGRSLSEELELEVPSETKIAYVKMKCAAKSDQIMLMVAGPARDGRVHLYSNFWDGDRWEEWQTVSEDLEKDPVDGRRKKPGPPAVTMRNSRTKADKNHTKATGPESSGNVSRPAPFESSRH